MSVSGHQERKITSLIGMGTDRRKCVQRTEERKDWGAGLGNLILGEEPVHGSAMSVSLASHSIISPASKRESQKNCDRASSSKL